MIIYDLIRPFSLIFTFVIRPRGVYGRFKESFKGLIWSKMDIFGVFRHMISLNQCLDTIDQLNQLCITCLDPFFLFSHKPAFNLSQYVFTGELISFTSKIVPKISPCSTTISVVVVTIFLVYHAGWQEGWWQRYIQVDVGIYTSTWIYLPCGTIDTLENVSTIWATN